MEDSPLFNAGKGAVFTAAGRNELDASIMDGASGKAGAVAGVTTVKNPITAARAVMEKTWHVLLAADGADAFAAEIGLETVEPGYFFTERRWEALQTRRAERRARAAAGARRGGRARRRRGPPTARWAPWHSTPAGQLAAGTSTGGMTNKRFGRVGDSPIIGAGTWADTRCATSGTGEGEYFIRLTIARDVCARLEYLGLSLAEAADQVIHGALGDSRRHRRRHRAGRRRQRRHAVQHRGHVPRLDRRRRRGARGDLRRRAAVAVWEWPAAADRRGRPAVV